MPVGKVVVHGLPELQRALKRIAADEAKQIDVELRAAGELVATSARSKLSAIDAGSAAGIKSKTKGFGRVVVEQTRRKVTGLRGDYGALQMQRALLPARAENADKVVEVIDHMLGRLAGEEGF